MDMHLKFLNKERSRHTDLGKLLDQVLLTRYLPTCVIIDQTMEIVHSRGPSAPYLAPASGQPSFNLLKMAHPDLVLELRSGIAQAYPHSAALRSPQYGRNNQAGRRRWLYHEAIPDENAAGDHYGSA
jgi:two-component system CheB/CheR fusion protein